MMIMVCKEYLSVICILHQLLEYKDLVAHVSPGVIIRGAGVIYSFLQYSQ